MNQHINIKQPVESVENQRYVDAFNALNVALGVSRQRLLLCLQGERGWCLSQLGALSMFDNQLVLSNASDLHPAIAFSKAENLLGQETDCVVYDAFGGIQLDVLCMAAGLIRAGGVLILLTPADPLQMEDRYGQWQDGAPASNYFLQYFFAELEPQMLRLAQSRQGLPLVIPDLPASQLTTVSELGSGEQQQLLLALDAWLVNKKIPIFLLTADRGRGKSTTLGMFARQHAVTQRIVVTAASRAQLTVLFKQLGSAQSQVQFIAPDELIRQQHRVELLIIDEAAMLANTVLHRCLALADKALLATTTGGYEGSGQGFLLKFKAGLAVKQYRHHQLMLPVRWGQQDRLEQWLNRVLMLKIEASYATDAGASYTIRGVSRAQLSQQSKLLRQVYALLLSAHYRTRPSDLRQLMDNDDQQLLLAEANGRVVGVLQLNREGGFAAELCEQVFMGTRRPRGHLLAQMITAQAGVRNFACFSGLRVQRIAVDAAYRCQGVGRALINAAQQLVQQQQLDYLGSSFAIDPGVALFWQKLGFRLLHISSGTGTSSGRQTVAVIRPQSAPIEQITAAQHLKLKNYLPVWLLGYCRNMDWTDVLAIIQLANVEYSFSEQDEDEISAFAGGFRGLELSQAVLQKLLIHRCSRLAELAPDLIRPAIEKIALNKHWQALPGHAGHHGKNELLKQLRLTVLQLNSIRKNNDEKNA